MIGYQNLHTHTTYCDGTLSPEGMLKAAIEKGCTSIGFSEHSYVPFDFFYSMDPAQEIQYVRDVNELKKKYEGVIEVFLGIEHDYFSDNIPDNLDYSIGTLHYVSADGQFHAVDAGVEHQEALVTEHFGGDYYSLAESYFSVFADIAKKTNADIIGHFDLLTKYNIDGRLFDEAHPRYVDAALSAMNEILKDRNVFEVNTGAMFRVNKPVPYPSPFLLKELSRRGGEVLISSDSHDPDSICYKFPEMQELLKTCGFKHIKRLTKSGFVNIDL